MTIDIIYRGLFEFFLIKRRAKKYFLSSQFVCRNNVFVDIQRDNIFYIEKNVIHISLSSNDTSNIQNACDSLKRILKNSFIGIKTNDLIYSEIKKQGILIGVRM